jgi:hypothetical protein
VRDEVLQLLLVSACVFFSELVVLLQIFGSLLLPNLANFFHNMKRRDVRHFASHSDPRLSHKEHVGCQRLLWHLVKQRLVVHAAQLGQLVREALFVSFGGLLVLLSLLF